MGLVQDHVEQDRRADRRDRQRRHQAVKPDAAIEAREPRADEQRQADVRRRVEAEVEDITPGREGRRAAVGKIPEKVADRPARNGNCQADPRRPFGGDTDGASCHRDDGEQLQPVVDPRTGEGVEPRSTRPDQDMQDEEEQTGGRGHDPRARDQPSPAGRERHADWSHTDYVGSGGRSIKLSAGEARAWSASGTPNCLARAAIDPGGGSGPLAAVAQPVEG